MRKLNWEKMYGRHGWGTIWLDYIIRQREPDGDSCESYRLLDFHSVSEYNQEDDSYCNSYPQLMSVNVIIYLCYMYNKLLYSIVNFSVTVEILDGC